jgi:hypothetical protein
MMEWVLFGMMVLVFFVVMDMLGYDHAVFAAGIDIAAVVLG